MSPAGSTARGSTAQAPRALVRPLVRPLVRITAVLAAAVALTSCRVDQTVTLDVAADGSGTVSVVLVADQGVVAKVPDLAADVRTDDLREAGWEVEGPDETDEGGLRLALTRDFATPEEATAILAQVGGASGPLRSVALARSGKDTNSVWTLTGALQVTGGLRAFIDDTGAELIGGAPFAGEVADAGLEIGEAVGIEFTVSLPGAIDSTTGVAGDRGITWRVPMDGSTIDVATTATNVDVGASVASVGRGILRFLLVVWVIGSLGLLSAVWWKNRARTPRL